MHQRFGTPAINVSYNVACDEVYNPESYHLSFINKGSFAVVLSAIKKDDPEKRFAIKVINTENFDKQNMDRVNREIEINGLVSHKNIVIVHEVYFGKTECTLVMELMEGGDLFSRIVDNGCMNETETKAVITQIIGAIKYLHQIRIAHRDIKPENIVFDKPGPNGIAKLIDFGFSKIEANDSESILKTPVGTIGYVAPEIIKLDSYRLSVDMWSVGCIVYFMLTQSPPFHAKTESEIEDRASKADFKFPPSIAISDRAKDFICNLLKLNPEDRITAEEALGHNWFLTTSLSKANVSTEKIDENLKSKLRESINQSIDAESRKDFNNNNNKSLDEYNLDAAENPHWQKIRKKNQITKTTTSTTSTTG